MRSKFLLALFLAMLSLSAAANDVEIGRAAPSLTLRTLDGHSISTDSLRGKVVILHFWATWCVPCQVELPLLTAYQKSHADQGLVVLGFSLDGANNLPQVRKMASTLNFPVGLLDSAWAGGYGRMWRLPVSFVIDRNGILRHDGWQDDQEPLSQETLDREVTPLLF